jgi:hypothetical protein
MGDTDVETFSNITRSDFDFDDDAFDTVSQEAKDFISNLLVHRKESRLTASQCLGSKWLSLENEDLSNVKICTDKLKTFVIRRKWQKTGNAIRALGRMSLQARRSSGTSAPSSPRPSISGPSSVGVISPTTVTRMSSLNEEDYDLIKTNDIVDKENCMLKFRNKICSERSDSGFSECSNCSIQISNHNSTCNCVSNNNNNSILSDKVYSISEENQSDVLEFSHESLSTKLEKITESQGFEDSFSSSKTSDSSIPLKNEQPSSPKIKFEHHDENKKNLIEIRKKSLEHSFLKDTIIKSSISVTPQSGRVSLLKEKFSPAQPSSSKSPSIKSSIDSIFSSSDQGISSMPCGLSDKKTGLINVETTKTSMDLNKNRSSVFNRRTNKNSDVYKTKPNAINKLKLNLEPNNNGTTRNVTPRTPTRLTGRVKEVTERLSAPKQKSPSLSTPTNFTTFNSIYLPKTNLINEQKAKLNNISGLSKS